ncbi:hypothetical protein VPJ68_00710, partial [Parabacteroides distasonis]
ASAESGRNIMHGKMVVRQGKRLFAKNAESKSESKHAVFSAGSEAQGATETVPAWDSAQKHQTNR